MKKIVVAGLCASALTSCAHWTTPEVWDDQTDSKVHTLRLNTGTHGESLYKGYFDEKAKEICKNGYEVLDKTNNPKTLHPKLHDEHYFNWVIRCK